MRWPEPKPFGALLPWAQKMEYYGVAGFGWGVAWLSSGRVGCYRFAGRLSEDDRVQNELADVSSTRYLVHLRRPSRLSTAQLADTQPFLAPKAQFAFCHNGLFKNEARFRGRYAAQLLGRADSEVGFRMFEDLLGRGFSVDEGIARTHAQLEGNANIGYLSSDGELVIFSAYVRNKFWRFRIDGADVAATQLHSADDSLFQLIFPTAVDRRSVTGANRLSAADA